MRQRARGSATAVAGVLVLSWVPWIIDPGSGWVSSAVQTAVFGALAVMTVVCPTLKVGVVRMVQRVAINPLVRVLLAVGLNPLGLVVIETTGRVTGRRRRNPVGSGERDGALWVIAEHGTRAGYVRNIAANPEVRVLIRRGVRHRWVEGVARLLPDDDPLARQRRIVGANPLRAFNAMTVRLMGAELLSVRIDLTPVQQKL